MQYRITAKATGHQIGYVQASSEAEAVAAYAKAHWANVSAIAAKPLHGAS